MAVQFRANELRELRITSSENISVAHDPQAEMDSLESIDVQADETFTWRKRPDTKNPFGDGTIDALYIRNRGVDEATIKVVTSTEVIFPEVRSIPIAAVGLFGVFLLYFLQFTLMPRLSAIALATFKSEIAQPLFVIVLILGIVMLLLSIYIPYNTFGEDIKMLKDSGLTLIRVLVHHSGRVGGEHDVGRRDRRAHGVDGSLEAGATAIVCDRQVLRDRLDDGADVHRAGFGAAGRGVVQDDLRRAGDVARSCRPGRPVIWRWPARCPVWSWRSWRR